MNECEKGSTHCLGEKHRGELEFGSRKTKTNMPMNFHVFSLRESAEFKYGILGRCFLPRFRLNRHC